MVVIIFLTSRSPINRVAVVVIIFVIYIFIIICIISSVAIGSRGN